MTRRWFLIGGCVLAVYSTLGLAREWAQALDRRGLIQLVTTSVVLSVAGLVIGWRWRSTPLRVRLVRAGIIVLLGTVAVFLKFPVERIHLVEYGLLGWGIGWALAGNNHWPKWWPLAVGLVWMIGAGDELIQGILPNRVFDVGDIILNGIGGMAGLALYQKKAESEENKSVRSKE